MRDVSPGGARAAEGRAAQARRVLRATTVRTPPVFAWSFLLPGDPEPFGERRTAQLGRLLLIITLCSSLTPSVLLRWSPITSTHAKTSCPLILASSEDTSLPAASPRGVDGAPAPAHSSFSKPEYVLGRGQDLTATSLSQNKVQRGNNVLQHAA